ncbi:hypothetical protein ACIOHB_37375 [Streptomyces microflavus]|uniref:hypothetical protein n=1 Tax=Streptomyces microflavus TaxID=1919 RepID=UPI0033C29CBC
MTNRFIRDSADLQLVRRARAWIAVLHELGAGGPNDPLFRALTVKGGLRSYPADRERGKRMRPGSLNERLQHLAEQAGVPYIDNKRVISHSWRAGANTGMKAGVSLAERNLAAGGHPAPRPLTRSTTGPTVSEGATRSTTRSPSTAGPPEPRWPPRVPSLLLSDGSARQLRPLHLQGAAESCARNPLLQLTGCSGSRKIESRPPAAPVRRGLDTDVARAEGDQGTHVLGVAEHLVVDAGRHVLPVAERQQHHLVQALIVGQVQ